MEFSVWLKERVETSTESTSLPRVLERCQECKEQQHPSKGRDPSACTEQLTPGPWHLRLPHFKMERVPNSGEELQSEYFVPRRFAAKALCAIAGISGIFRQWLRSSEIRAIAADDLLMSPHSKDFVGDDGSVGFHFTWKLAEVEVKSMALPEIERVLEPFDARPPLGQALHNATNPFGTIVWHSSGRIPTTGQSNGSCRKILQSVGPGDYW